MYIKKIIYFNKVDREAELCISDGVYSVISYAYPVNAVVVNQEVDAIYGFECTNVVRATEQNYRINKLPAYFAYEVTAEVISICDNIVKVGDLRIYLDAVIPNDVSNGEYVSFSVLRFDFG